MQHALPHAMPYARPRGAPRPPSPAAPPPRGPRVRSLIDADALGVLHRAARTLLDDLPELTERLLAALREQEPAYRTALGRDPEGIRQEAHRSLRHSVASLLDPRGTREAARRCTWRIGTVRAEEGLPLDALLHAFRLGGSLVWQALVEETSRTAPEDTRLLIHVAADVWNFVDEHCTLVAEAYRQAERHLLWRRENRQRVLAAALLDGTSRIADLPETARALGLPEDGRYVVLAVAGPGRPRTGEDGALRAALVPAGARVHWQTGAEADHGIVLLPEGDAEALPRPGAEPLAGARVGIGAVAEGLAAVGEARAQADLALGICPPGGGHVRLDEHLPEALLLASPELGAALVARVLGGLLAVEPGEREVLLATLAAWFACEGSARRVGERLFCHRNTVLNRLRRCERLTGRLLGRPADAAELSLALTAHRLRSDAG
ncbi:PucR family transcriptional regulator [Streptomyces griseoaurantiacus]|uniref:PucR family transcriptional regulator n=1 Tax=Streptomyces griseoaurantiacus TaxID=68213 RepID=UPI001782B3B8|nr:PucR family transcriptional regulator [Streptomyces griseoaurantiacus]